MSHSLSIYNFSYSATCTLLLIAKVPVLLGRKHPFPRGEPDQWIPSHWYLGDFFWEGTLTNCTVPSAELLFELLGTSPLIPTGSLRMGLKKQTNEDRKKPVLVTPFEPWSNRICTLRTCLNIPMTNFKTESLAATARPLATFLEDLCPGCLLILLALLGASVPLYMLIPLLGMHFFSYVFDGQLTWLHWHLFLFVCVKPSFSWASTVLYIYFCINIYYILYCMGIFLKKYFLNSSFYPQYLYAFVYMLGT